LLKTEGVNAHAKDWQGRTPRGIAAGNGNEAIVKLLRAVKRG
jgi:hypothetical protein